MTEKSIEGAENWQFDMDRSLTSENAKFELNFVEKMTWKLTKLFNKKLKINLAESFHQKKFLEKCPV